MEVANNCVHSLHIWLIRTLITLHRVNPAGAFGRDQPGSYSLPSSGEG